MFLNYGDLSGEPDPTVLNGGIWRNYKEIGQVCNMVTQKPFTHWKWVDRKLYHHGEGNLKVMLEDAVISLGK